MMTRAEAIDLFHSDDLVGIGMAADAVRRKLHPEEKYKDGMSQDESISLGLEALQKSSEEKLEAKAVEVGVIVDGEKFRRLPEDEVGRYLSRIPTAS